MRASVLGLWLVALVGTSCTHLRGPGTCQASGGTRVCAALTTSTSTTTSTISTTTTIFALPTQPIAAILPPAATVLVGQSVSLNSASRDPQGQALSLQWDLSSVPQASGATLLGTSTARPYFVPDVPGVYTVHLLVDANGRTNEANATITAVTHSALSLAITSPVDGASIGPRRVRVQGTITAPPNTGVTVNGRLALVSAGVFMVDALPLEPGDNVIVATATAVAGDTLATSVRVSSEWQPQILQLRALERSALARKTVTFEYAFQSAVSVSSLAMDFDGDGHDDLTTSDPASPLTFQYNTPGLYVARLTLVDTNNATYQADIAVEADNLTEIDLVFQNLWSAIRSALLAGDVASALQFVTPDSRPKFESIWTALLPNLSAIYASYSPLQGYDITRDFATYFITRVVNDEQRVYFVSFIRDADGVWRLEDM